ncbi:MAG TPA: hypothetical protein QGF43_03795 [Acidimicrobiales bacterium]|jgi:hypothetical protein|nr:hypothetical protein [Acidimicrobiaceae bacterium]MBM17368.1 hypothetical protein [Actinomycetota bacterium]MDP6280264.1 hypothetical protein [Acidimicrobiales bacterium]MBP91546.1 hypothetical protein [Acidimicrobiaceae bacterium]MDP6482012.1 hypothetical protein [Acidimicrobiales bacterium]|tara:strand:- start:459 stop:767 length:309 start_codon:yes stop_codon:yes gene_type:complete
MKHLTQTTWEVAQGREGDFIKVCRRSTQIHQRLGAEKVLLLNNVAGPGHTMTYVCSFPDAVALGAFLEALPSDDDWRALGGEFVSDPPARMVSQHITQDLFS